MLSRFLKEVSSIELYGKLPIAKDYLRVGGGKGAGIALRDWIDQGFSTLVDREAPPSLAWPGRFIVSHYAGDPLMGCSWPSSDSGGLRPFPFTTFISRRRRVLTTDWGSGGASLRPLWDQLVGVYTAHRSYSDGQSFLAAMRGKQIEIGRAAPVERQRIDYGLWVNTLWPDGGVDELVRVLVSLGRLARQGWTDPIRLPLVAGLPSIPQVHAWWTALTKLEFVARGATPSVFFPLTNVDSDAPHFVTFELGPLDPSKPNWLARPTSPLGPSDHASSELRIVHEHVPPGDATPPLSESLRGPLVSARARSGA